MVLVGSADQYLAGCWHSQESTKLCTRNDDNAIDQDDPEILRVIVPFLSSLPEPRRTNRTYIVYVVKSMIQSSIR